MTLTVKQRAKVNAALCLIHDNGLDANAVTQLAHTIIATGHDARTSYERALNQFADGHPAIAPALGKITGLIEASCPRTVAQYDQALSSYIATGDDSALTALAPMIAEDSVALAVANGEMTPEEAGEGAMAKALGLDPSPEFASLTRGEAPRSDEQAATAPAPNPAPTGERATFSFVGLTDAPAPASAASQSSIGGDGPGMVAPKAQRHWSDAPYTGPLSVGQGSPTGTSFAAAKEAARASIANRPGAIIEDAPQGS